MKLSIVSVNYRSWGHLENALNALTPGFPDDWEIIVVDNASEPVTFAEFSNRYPWVRFIANPVNSGFGFGCRIGVAEATGEQLLFMNPDVVAGCDDIDLLLQVKSRHPHAAIIAPRQVDQRGRPQKVFDEFPGILNQSKLVKSAMRLLNPRRFPDPHAEHRELVWCDWVTGSVLLIDRDHYDAIGGWSSDYWMYAEDADLCRKAQDAGLKVAYTPDVEVVHAHGGSSRINVATRSLTKLEVIISKHVYAHNHAAGLRRWLMHIMIAVTRLPVLILGALLNVLTLGQIPTLRVRGKMLVELVRYYAGVRSNNSWLSPRALENQS